MDGADHDALEAYVSRPASSEVEQQKGRREKMAEATSSSPAIASTGSPTDDDPSTSPHLSKPLELPIAAPLSHDLFLSPTFSPDAFLLSRRHTSLDDLRSDLRSYLTTLRSQLVALINEDYEDFIGLGMGLRGTVERGLGKMRGPVDEVRREVDEARERLEEVKKEVERELEERRKIREGKKLVKIMLDCGSAVSKVEDMLGIAQTASTQTTTKERRSSSVSLLRRPVPSILDDSTFDSGPKRIERIAAEFNQTLYLVSLAKSSAYVTSLSPRIERARAALRRDLDGLFKGTLKVGESGGQGKAKREALVECLRTYETLGLVKEAQDLVKREVVLPGLAEIVEPSALHGGLLSPVLPVTPFSSLSKQLSFPSPSSTTTSTTGYDPLPVPEDTEAASLPTLYNKLLAFVARDLSQVIDIADRQLTSPRGTARSSSDSTDPPSSAPGFDLFRNAVVVPLLQSLSSTLGQTLFASGNPTLFHRHFSQTQLFLSRLEGFCSSRAQVQRIRKDPEWIAFGNRWQLAVYAQLRTREVVAKLEEALSDGGGKGEPVGAGKKGATGFGYSMKATEAAHLAVWTIWQDEVFLAELAHRFWRLTLQVLSRYRTWLQTALPAYHAPSSSTGAALAAPSNAPASNRKSFDAGRRNETARPATPAEEEASEDATLHQLAIFVADMQRLEEKGLELFAERIGPRLPTMAVGEKGLTAEALMRRSLASTTSIIPSLSSQITNILIKRCAERLRFIRSVGSSARSSRTMPTQPSYFVADILKDLRSFLDGPARVVAPAMRSTWATTVADEIASRYAGILLNIQKTEDSLRKIKKGRQGFSLFGRSSAASAAAADPQGTSEEDAKVKKQMQLDVDRLAADAEGAGVRVGESKAFKELRRTLEEEPGRTAA